MSTLTKISVVVLAVVALLATPIFIQTAVMGPKWKAIAQNYQDRAKQSDIQTQNYMLAEKIALDQYAEEKKRADELARDLANVADTKNVQIAQLSQQVSELQGRLNEQQELAKSLQATVASLDKQREGLQTGIEDVRKTNIQVSDQLRRELDRIRELLAQGDSLTKNVRSLQEQLAEREQQARELQAKLEDTQRQLAAAGGRPLAQEAAPTAPEKIEGSVTSVIRDLASLNVGAAAGVKKGMEFILYRGGEYVARLRIADVDASSSAGVIFDGRMDVRNGDKATTSLE